MRRNLHSTACFPAIAHKRTRARSSIWRSSDGLLPDAPVYQQTSRFHPSGRKYPDVLHLRSALIWRWCVFNILKKRSGIIDKSPLFNLTSYLPCLSVLATLTHASMKRGIWPVYYAFHISMLHREVVDIIHMFFIIPLITYQVFPKTALPDCGFFSLSFRFAHPIFTMQIRTASFCEESFYHRQRIPKAESFGGNVQMQCK